MLYLFSFLQTNSYNCAVPEISMCDRVLIVAMLENLGYFDEKREKEKKVEVHDEEQK